MKSYFAYIRVSTVKQGERGSSLQEQRSAIESYAQRHSLHITEWFEEKETAAKQGRAVFSRMLAQLERGTAQGLVVHKIDRSARNLKDWANLGALIDRGVDVHFAHDSVDLRSRGGRLSADIQAVVAADYIRNLRDEVLKGYYGRLKQGLYPLPAPVGYLDRGKGKPKEIDPVRGPLVRHAFERYATGRVGLKDLRIELAAKGLVSTRSGKTLSLCGISTMLNNPFYTGIVHIKRTNETYKGQHEPLIPKSLFDRVQAILRGKVVLRFHKHDYLFRLTVRCVGCGYHLIGEKQKRTHIYYRCHSDACKGVSIREIDIDHALQMELRYLQLDAREQQALRMVAATMRKEIEGDTEQIRAALRLRLGKLEERLARLTDAFVDEAIDRALFENRKRACIGEQQRITERLNTLSDSAALLNQALEHLERGNMALFGYRNGIYDEKRDMVSAITSNFSAQGKNLTIALKSPYQEVVNWRKMLEGAPYHGRPAKRARKLLEIAIAAAKKERKTSIAKNDLKRAA